MSKRNRRIFSVKNELLKKSREAAMAAVQIFNNPNITFKSESYIVLMIIAWTYLLHAYYHHKRIDYRYSSPQGKRRKFDKTKHNAYKFWSLERCLNVSQSPIDRDTKNNLEYLIGLRHEIEHRMTTRIDDLLSASFQACCLNYNDYIKKLFGDNNGIENHLSFSLQFSAISAEQKELLQEYPNLPSNILSYMRDFGEGLTEEEFSSPRFGYRILFIPKTANRKGQADRVVEFISNDSPLAENINKSYAIIKETEKKKYLPKKIVELMRDEGFTKFTMHNHTQLWKQHDARNSSKYGTWVTEKQWYWYENWVDVVRKHCVNERGKYQ